MRPCLKKKKNFNKEHFQIVKNLNIFVCFSSFILILSLRLAWNSWQISCLSFYFWDYRGELLKIYIHSPSRGEGAGEAQVYHILFSP